MRICVQYGMLNVLIMMGCCRLAEYFILNYRRISSENNFYNRVRLFFLRLIIIKIKIKILTFLLPLFVHLRVSLIIQTQNCKINWVTVEHGIIKIAKSIESQLSVHWSLEFGLNLTSVIKIIDVYTLSCLIKKNGKTTFFYLFF